MSEIVKAIKSSKEHNNKLKDDNEKIHFKTLATFALGAGTIFFSDELWANFKELEDKMKDFSGKFDIKIPDILSNVVINILYFVDHITEVQ